MSETALFDHVEVPVDLLDLFTHRYVICRLCFKFVLPDGHHFFVVQINHLLGVLENCRHVGSEKVLVFGDTDDQRTSVAYTDDFVRLALTHDHQSVGAFELRHRFLHGLFQCPVFFVEFLDQVGDHLGIGFGYKFVALFFQLSFDCDIVLYNSIVNDRQVTCAVDVGVGILGIGLAVSGPTRMRHTDGAVELAPRKQVDQP